jgi:hypothetical protein
MIIYIVIKSDYRGDHVEEVYVDKQKAEQHADRLNKPGYQGTVIAREVKE